MRRIKIQIEERKKWSESESEFDTFIHTTYILYGFFFSENCLLLVLASMAIENVKCVKWHCLRTRQIQTVCVCLCVYERERGRSHALKLHVCCECVQYPSTRGP